MNAKWNYVALGLGSVLLFNHTAWGFKEPGGRPLMDFDQRQAAVRPAAAAVQAKAEAVTRLKAALASAQVDFDPVLGTPHYICNRRGFLTGPKGQGLTAEAFVNLGDKDPHRVTKAFVRQHQELFGHGPALLDAARVKRDYTGPHNGLRTVVWEQHLEDIAIFEAVFIAHTTRNGELVNVSSTLLPEPTRAAEAGAAGGAGHRAAPAITAAEALALAAAALEVPLQPSAVTATGPVNGANRSQRLTAPGLKGETTAQLTWLPMSADSLRLCWDIIAAPRARGEVFRLLVDARTGEVLLRRCLTQYATNATYRVFTSDSPTPFSPGHPTPLTNQPPVVERQLITWIALDTNASPNGWIDDGVNETRGNNVDAHTDRNDDDSPDLPRPQAAPGRVFDFTMDLNQSPTTYSSAAVAQLFYLCNWMHDRLYGLGFTEAAGNFQNNNFDRGGLGNDALQADAQDGGAFNNATMYTPPDGSPPRMQMYLFDGPNPDRDGDFDAEIVLHEYTHGLSNRRVGGGVGLSALQSEGMGEGWSDFYPLALLSEPADDPHGNYPSGAYACYLLGGLRENYYFGIRRYPYSTDMMKNPLTFKDIDPTQADSHAGIPRNPIIGSSASEVHNQGEVWCITLWEGRANLVAKHGFTAGNELMLQLVTDGLALSPPNPTFVQARDAILQADRVYTGGANQRELWEGFAKRGLGFSAVAPPSSTTTGVRESFDPPDDLYLTPASGFTASGPVGGPFAPLEQTYSLTNVGSNSFTWTAGSTSSWLMVTPASGALGIGGSATVTVSIGPAAASLVSGFYSGHVRFTNNTSSVVQSRQVLLRVGLPDYFVEQFTTNNDLAYSTFTFTPDGSANFYRACRMVATNFPTDPLGGTNVSLADDSYATVTLPAGTNVSVYGVRSNVFYIGSNGYLTWEEGDDSLGGSPAAHFRLPRVSALFDDLDPSDGGSISWKFLSNRVAVTYQDVPEYSTANRNNFQIELFFDGRIRLTYLRLDARDGLAGLSPGGGTPLGFEEMDLSGLGECLSPLRLVVPAEATEGAGLLAGQGTVRLPEPRATNLTVLLASSETNEVTVPPAVLCVAGQTNVPFDLIVQDDAVLDGTQPVVVSATAPGFGLAESTIHIHDNESAALSVTLPATAVEGSGPAQGTVEGSAAPARNVRVTLTSGDLTEILVPAVVVIPAGQTSAVFSVTVVDDWEIDGPQTAGVLAHVQNWADGSASMTVFDNEPLTLTVTLPATVYESAGVLTNAGRVSLAGTLPTNLVVALASGDLSELIVPASVTIPAGQFSAAFNLALQDDPLVDGLQHVTVAASAAGFTNGSATLIVLDDESPPVPTDPVPADLAVNVSADTDLAWSDGRGSVVVNGGFETGDFTGWTRIDTGLGQFAINDGTFIPLSGDGHLPPFDGGFSVVSDQSGAGRHTLYQDVVVPLGSAARLHWAQRLRNQAGVFASNQSFQVEIRDPSEVLLAVAYATQPGDPVMTDWTEQQFDLTPFAGQTVRLAFVEQDELGLFNAHVDAVRIVGGIGGAAITNEVYFGTNPAPGPAELVGVTTNLTWTLPRLEPLTTYYWQIVAHRVGVTPGPVWQFTTRGVDHFDWSAISSPQVVGSAFEVTVTARDEFSRAVSNFTGAVTLRGQVGTLGPTNVLLYDDTYQHGFRTALEELGVAFEGYDHDSLAAFNAALQAADPAVTLAVVDAAEYPHDFAELAAFVTAGGWAILEYWNLDAVPTVAAAFQASVAADMFTPEPVYDWGGSDLFAGLPNPVNFIETSWNDDGDRLNALPGARAVGGFVSSPTASAAALIVGNEGRTILNGFMMDNAQNPSNGVQLAKNEILALLGTGSLIAITPTNSGPFVGGAWTGAITVLEPATNMVLLARDAEGHRGLSGPFDVMVRNDLAISITDLPDPVAVANPLIHVITVVNSGPDEATEVTVTNVLPPGVVFIAAIASQGSCLEQDGVVRCELGRLAGGDSVMVMMVSWPTGAGSITNWAFVGRAETDGYDGNNVAAAVTDVRAPALSISDAAVVEGNSGQTPAIFTVQLSPSTMQTVTVAYATSDLTAQAGSDYLPTNGTLTFPPGQTSQFIHVNVVGDTNSELTETFQVTLSNPMNAMVDRAVGTGTIVNDEVPPIAYLRSMIGVPWGEPDNEAALTRVFGAEGWQDLRFETVLPEALFSPATRFIFMDGGADTWSAMEGFLVNHLPALSNWVAAGGRLLLNAAPFFSSTFSGELGFGVTLNVGEASFTGAAVDAAHPIFNEPFVPVGTTWTGNYFAHATISGSGVEPLIEDSASSQPVLAEMLHGGGRVLFGGMTMPSFHSPTTEAANLRANLIAYAALHPVTPQPRVVAAGSALLAESCGTGNGAIDPGETVMISFGLRNRGSLDASNVIATLLPTGGVTLPSGPQNYGLLLAGGATVSNAFTFTADGPCGSTLVATLQIQDGTNDLGRVSFIFRLGQPLAAFVENFDGVVAPALPPGWTAVLAGAGSPWATTTAQRDTLPNAVFAPDPSTSCDNQLTSPSFFVPSDGGQLRFRHAYSTEFCCDGGRLEISIAGGAFMDWLEAGGTFVTNGYNLSYGWYGTSAGFPSFITTVANLPPAAQSQNIRLRWRFTADSSISGTGWYVDTVSVGGDFVCCLENDLFLTLTDAPDPVTAGSNLTYTVSVTNTGPMLATAVVVSNVLPAQVEFVSALASQGTCTQDAGVIVCSLGTLAGGAGARLTFVVVPHTNLASMVSVTNRAVVTRAEPDTYLGNNSASAVTLVRPLPSGETFQIAGLFTSNSRVVEHDSLTGDDRGGIAASGSHVFYSGDSATARFALADLSGGASLGRVYDALVSDLRTEQVYSLGNGTNLLGSGGGTITTLIPLNAVTLQPAGAPLTLSQPISMNWGGVFAGFGRVVLWNGSRVYDIALPGGQVADLGAVTLPAYQGTENWAFWGVAEFWDGAIHLAYVRDAQTIVRTRVPDGVTTVLASFSSLSDMACFTVSPLRNRWYFHHEGSSQFGGTYETIGYADADFLYVMPPTPPTIVTNPVSQTVLAGESASFHVTARGSSPLAYQWWFNGARVEGGTNASLTLSEVTTNAAGVYLVVVTNSFGFAQSAPATLTVVPVVPLGEALDAPHLAWTTGGNAPWLGQTLTTHDGADAGQSGRIDHGQQSWMEITVQGPGPLTFWWKVSSQSSGDYLRLLLDGTPIATISGEVNWTWVSNYVATAGPRVLRWVYAKNASVVSGQDRGWVDQVRFVEPCTNCPPIVTTQPVGATLLEGAAAQFHVEATGTAPLSYQWRFFDTNLPAATNPTLTLANAQSSQSGPYVVIVANAFGAATSQVAALLVTNELVRFFDDFEPDVDLPQWASFGGVVGSSVLATNFGGRVSGQNSLWFGAAGARHATTRQLDVSSGGRISFHLRMADGADDPWERVESPDKGVTLQYSVNSGATWTTLASYAPSNFIEWTQVTLSIPPAARTFGTQFRWQQSNHDGLGHDHWALDDTWVSRVLPPTLLVQPASTTVPLGEDAVFRVEVAGTPPFTFQWGFNGFLTAEGVESTTHASTLTLTNVSLAQDGGFAVVIVSNLVGQVLSTNAVLRVYAPPILTLQPTNVTVNPGETARFTVAATGKAPLRYQWQFDGVNLSNKTASTLTLTNVQATNEGFYSVTVTNRDGQVQSESALLTVLMRPWLTELTIQPGGRCCMFLEGNLHRNYAIEISEDLLSWSHLATLRCTNRHTAFSDLTATNGTQRFYRARLLP